MGDDVVHFPAHAVQIGPGNLVLPFAGKLLFPPRAVVHPVQRPAVIEDTALPLKLRIVRFQDAASDVVAAGPAHRKELFPLDAVDLSIKTFLLFLIQYIH